MDRQYWLILECVVNMGPVNLCLQEIISADVTKITQGTTVTKKLIIVKTSRVRTEEVALMALRHLRVSVLMDGRASSASKILMSVAPILVEMAGTVRT